MIKIYDKVEKLPEPKKRKLEFEEYSRYSRQLILPEIGKSGQENIFNSTVLVVGCGGLGMVLFLNFESKLLYKVKSGIAKSDIFVKNEKIPLLIFFSKKF